MPLLINIFGWGLSLFKGFGSGILKILQGPIGWFAGALGIGWSADKVAGLAKNLAILAVIGGALYFFLRKK